MSRAGPLWRGAGLALYGGGVLLGFRAGMEAAPGSATATLAPVGGLVVAMIGLVLALHGRRVAQVLRIEQSRHRHLPAAIGASRRQARSAEGVPRS